MSARVKMNASFMPQLTTILDQRVGATARALRDICKAKVSTPYPPPSAPGQPPHLRSGGLKRAIFAERIAKMDWCFGVREVAPVRPTSNRSWLGLWLELGTGTRRQPFGAGAMSSLPRGGAGMWFGSPQEDTATTGSRSNMAPRPFLIPTLLQDGPNVLRSVFNG